MNLRIIFSNVSAISNCVRLIVALNCLSQLCFASKFCGRVVNEKGHPIQGATVTLWTQSGKHLGSCNSDENGTYCMIYQGRPIQQDGPLEVLYEASGKHAHFIKQIYGRSDLDATVVLMPEEGPITYERVYDALATYERLYYVMRAASTLTTVTSHQRLQELYGDRILEIPNPDGNRLRDTQFRQRVRDDQIRLLRLKRDQVRELYGL